MLISVLILLWLCSPVLSQEPPQIPKIETQEQTKGGLKAEKKDREQTQAPEQPSTVVPKIEAQAAKGESHSKPSEGDEQGTEFWPPLWGYRLKVTDTLLVVVTFLLFLATIALHRATKKLVKGSEIVEKAYVSGGGPYRPDMRCLQLDINNYGKTAAYLLRVQIGFCEADDPPPVPTYLDGFSFDLFDHLPPGLRQKVLRLIPIPNNLQHPAIFGRFHYRDVFEKNRSSGFILRIVHIDDQRGFSEPILAPEPYTEDTEE